VLFGQLAAPAIPTNGAYLGAWVNPADITTSSGEPGSQEITQLPAFNTLIGKHVAILHVYTPWATPLPTTTLAAIEANGSIPLIDWGRDDYTTITAGKDDGIIENYANALKAFAKPVFLRWDWEMNLHGNLSYGTSTQFQYAWQRIYDIYHCTSITASANQVAYTPPSGCQSATNVAFVWCPGAQSNEQNLDQSAIAAYYPGNSYVDWIAADGYDHTGDGTSAFGDIFGPFYNYWSSKSYGKPMMVAETGAQGTVDQAQYLEGIQTDVPTQYSDIRAIVYFDDQGATGDWSIGTSDASGVQAFQTLADDSYFSFDGE
jgi:beta-mannanase